MVWIVRHTHWFFVAALVALLGSAVFGSISLTAAALVAVGFTVALFASLLAAGIAQERAMSRVNVLGEDMEDSQRPTGWIRARYALGGVPKAMQDRAGHHETMRRLGRRISGSPR